MGYLGPLAVILAAIVALSGLIISKKPDLKPLFDKIGPFTGFLGVFLLAWGVYDLIHYVLTDFGPVGKSRFGFLMSGIDIGGQSVGGDKVAAIALIGYIISSILLGFMLGFGLIAQWIPGESGAEKKAVVIQKKLLGLSVPIGFIGLACAVLWIIKDGPSAY